MGRDAFPWYRASHRAWYVNHGGKQVKLHADKATAFDLWHAMRHAAGTDNAVSVAATIDAHLAELATRCRPATVARRREVLELLRRDHGARVAFTPDDARAWIDTRATWGRSMRWLAALALRACFGWALSRLRYPSPMSRGGAAVIDDATHAALLAVASPALRDVLVFLRATGCRPGEMARITAADFDAASRTVSLGSHKTDGTGRRRVIYLDDAAVSLLTRLAATRPAGVLFRTSRGAAWSKDSWTPATWHAAKRAGVRATLYGYRHTYATRALALGIPDAVVAALLGHSVAMLHRHYAHLGDAAAQLRDAAARIARRDG